MLLTLRKLIVLLCMSVMDALKLKHPESQIPPESVLPCCDSLPYFEDLEITAAHV